MMYLGDYDRNQILGATATATTILTCAVTLYKCFGRQKEQTYQKQNLFVQTQKINAHLTTIYPHLNQQQEER